MAAEQSKPFILAKIAFLSTANTSNPHIFKAAKSSATSELHGSQTRVLHREPVVATPAVSHIQNAPVNAKYSLVDSCILRFLVVLGVLGAVADSAGAVVCAAALLSERRPFGYIGAITPSENAVGTLLLK